jgi:hypothetical protein
MNLSSAAHGLANRAGQHTAEGRCRQDQGWDRALHQSEAQHHANDAPDAHGEEGFEEAHQRTAGAAMMLAQGPHAFRTSGHY